MKEPVECPNCNISWLSPNTMPEDILYNSRSRMDMTLDNAKVQANRFYGWTEDNDKRFSVNMYGVEYADDSPEHYDGISEWCCTNCEARIGRWSGKILENDEYEKRFGGH